LTTLEACNYLVTNVIGFKCNEIFLYGWDKSSFYETIREVSNALDNISDNELLLNYCVSDWKELEFIEWVVHTPTPAMARIRLKRVKYDDRIYIDYYITTIGAEYGFK